MLKSILLALSALLLFFALGGAIVVGARSLSVPVSYAEQQDCLSRAQAENNAHPDCPKTETVWDRGERDPIAFYTLWLTLFTLALAIGAAVQSGLIGRQIALTRQEFVATHRPRLRIRLLRMDRPVLGNPITIRYEVINVGETPATVIDNEITLRIRSTAAAQLHNQQPAEVTRTRHFRFAEIIAQGEAVQAAGAIADFDPAWGHAAADTWWWGDLFVIGAIRYSDDNGVTRRTAFYRRATSDLNRFEFMEEFTEAQKADHEYED